jgi:membrane protease YdiL (CAAX protease family)
MFQPLDQWLAYILLFAFPITIAFAELATYFGYIMPRLEKKLNNKWMSLLLPVLFLSMQHCTLPFIPDINFIIYRGLVFLPFALLLGISIRLRPTLFPFFAILHGMMDFGTAMMFITI